MYRLCIFLSILLLSSCYHDPNEKPFGTSGLRPIYSEIGNDISQDAMQFNDLTNIVTYQELILALEDGVGIHVINNSDPENPANIQFIPIFGLNDIAITEDIIIANSGGALISIDISDRSMAIFKAITYIENSSGEGENFYPSNYFGLFECVDPDKGIVISWDQVDMTDSDCWR